MNTNSKKGKIYCKRIISYNEIAHLLSENSVTAASEQILKSEQNTWMHNNADIVASNPKWKMLFCKDCFPIWSYTIAEKVCNKVELDEAVKEGYVWDLELTVECDSKLTAYKILKNEKE
jgi:hypothetical protein